MELDLQTAQRLVTTLLNLAVAVLMGASASRLWLGRDASSWAAVRRRAVRKAAVVGAAVALLSNFVALWLESAAMAEVPVRQAASVTVSMLTSTHLGLAWSIGMVGLLAAAGAALVPEDRIMGPTLATMLSLALFWYTRSMASHASSDGDFSIRLLADWAHLGLISLWVGEVMIAGAIILRTSGSLSSNDRRARASYVGSLSSSATIALSGIFVTGVYAAWRSIDGWSNLIGNPYGATLIAKVLLVGAAAALGGFNRFFVMRPWLARESAGEVTTEAFPARFKRILCVEAVVLLAVVVLAAWLASTSPPGEQM